MAKIVAVIMRCAFALISVFVVVSSADEPYHDPYNDPVSVDLSLQKLLLSSVHAMSHHVNYVCDIGCTEENAIFDAVCTSVVFCFFLSGSSPIIVT